MSSSPQAFSVQTMTRVVRPGDKVTLSCSIQHQNQTVWYGQQSNKLPFIIIISARKHHLRLKEVLNKFYKGNNYGFTTMFENNNSIILTICNMTGSLLALYYCTSGVGEETVFGLGHVLAYKNASVASKCDDEKLDESSMRLPESSVQCWVLMGILCSLSAAVAALLAFICTWIFHRKGNNELERRKIDQGRNNDVQGGEEGVLYSALHFSNGDRRSKGKNTHN
ncbi:uncharacterized protein LOC123491662 isoform X1 [Coregonus clupeaformis]|uniref:uncharacterized protein LOC123491662 isoform X1 n=1 Tax=Coregonus clupeaformis TaxID=59861 RepID=UPI001E1C54D8|nr:uncharacterized protein LOC123491662 isoform X1 [Coregonus clupeaformis]